MGRGQLPPAVTAVLVSLLMASSLGCSRTEERSDQAFPELPEAALDGMTPAVRDQIRSAYEDARAQGDIPVIQGRLAATLHAYEQPELAVPHYERAMRLDPEWFGWPYLLGRAQMESGEPEAAIPLLQVTLRLKEDYLPARVLLATLLMERGELEPSKTQFETALTQDPDSALARYQYGRLLARLGETQAAVSSLRRAVELFEAYGAAHYALGMAYRDLGELDSAKHHLTLSQRHRDDSPPSDDPALEAIHHLDIGPYRHLEPAARLANSGRLDEAIASYERVLEIDPTHRAALAALITLHGRKGDLDATRRAYEHAISMAPAWAESHYRYGLALLQQRRFAGAVDALEKAIEANPYFASAHAELGVALEQMGQEGRAMQHFRLALEYEPGHPRANFQLANRFASSGNIEDAIEHLTRAVRVDDPQAPRIQAALAELYRRSGDSEAALFHLRQARDKAATAGQTDLASRLSATIEAQQKASSAR